MALMRPMSCHVSVLMLLFMCPLTAQVMAFMLFNFAHEADVHSRQAASVPAEMPQVLYAY